MPPRSGYARSLRFALGWLLAATTAVGLSWTVIRAASGPEIVPPPVVSLPAARAGTPVPAVAATGTAGTAAGGMGATGTRAVPVADGPRASGAAGPSAGLPSSATGTGARTGPPVHRYRVTGGVVVLDERATSVRLLDATPAAGYRVQTWQATGWLRVQFSSPGHVSSVYVTWNGHPPSVQTVES